MSKTAFLARMSTDSFETVVLPPSDTLLDRSLIAYVFPEKVGFHGKPSVLHTRFHQLASRAGLRPTDPILTPSGNYLVALRNGQEAPDGVLVNMGIARQRLAVRNEIEQITSGDQRRLTERARSLTGLSDQAHRLIGLNRLGQAVFDTTLGRAVVGQNRDGLRAGAQLELFAAPADIERAGDLFLRAATPRQFELCVGGLAASIMTGRAISRSDADTFYRDVTEANPELRDMQATSREAMREILEARMAASFSRLVSRSDAPAARQRELATQIIRNLPDTQNAQRTGDQAVYQQFSTPFTMAVAGFEAIAPQNGDRLLEPTIGNGVLSSPFAGRSIEITGVEIDAARADRVRGLPGLDRLLTGDFLQSPDVGDGYDLLVANPPFDSLPGGVDSVRRPDHTGREINLRNLHSLIAFEGLQRLKPTGRAFLVLPADRVQPERIDGARAFFDAFLHSRYEVAGAAVADGDLYRKFGTRTPTLLYAVGPRRPEPLSGLALDDVLGRFADADNVRRYPVLSTEADLFAWSAATRATMLDLSSLQDTTPRFVARPPVALAPDAPAPAPQEPAPPSAREPAPPPAASPPPQAPSPAPSPPPSQQSSPAPAARAPAPAQAAPTPGGGRGSSRSPAPLPEAVPSTPTPEAEDDAWVDAQPVNPPVVDDLESDLFSVRYEPFAELEGQTGSTLIQKSLQEGAAKALLRIVSEVGDITDYVGGKLRMDRDRLGKALSPEQVDALALAFHRFASDDPMQRGFLVADKTGVGKGRTLASLAYEAMSNERPTIFFTLDPALFTDFLSRDMADVSGVPLKDALVSRAVKPVVFHTNSNASIYERPLDDDDEGPRPKPLLRGAIPDRLPVDANLVMSTYSQLSAQGREKKTATLLDFIREQGDNKTPVRLVLDEAHKAAGDTSAVGTNVQLLVNAVIETGGDVAYSSATPMKSVKNIRVYAPILPPTGMSPDQLVELIETDPLALQESLSSDMASAGSMISRELDMRGVVTEFLHLTEIDEDRRQNIIGGIDTASSYLAELRDLSDVVKDVVAHDVSRFATVNGIDQKTCSAQITSPVSQFHHYAQYLLTAVQAEYAEDYMLRAVANGEKPLFAIDGTGETLLGQVLASIGYDEPDGAGKTRRVFDRPPHIGDVIANFTNRLCEVTIKGPDGEQQKLNLLDRLPRAADLIERTRNDPILARLRLDALDRLNDVAEKHGMTFAEITGRKTTIRPVPDDPAGRLMVEPRSKANKNAVIASFNNGETDVIALNCSAATGLSAHSSLKTGRDLRTRAMIFLALQGKVDDQIQMMGRIQRFAAHHPAHYIFPMAGLPTQDRAVMMFNKKGASLSATSSGSRNTRSNIDNVPDLLNEVGGRVCHDYLSENPTLAATLGVTVSGEGEGVSYGDVARKLVGRLVMLPVEQQHALMSELDLRFGLKVAELDALGINPLKLRELDLKAETTTVAEILAAEGEGDSIGAQAVNLTRLRYRETLQPIRSDGLEALVDQARSALSKNELNRYMSPTEYVGSLFQENGHPDFTHQAFDNALLRSLKYKMTGHDELQDDALANAYDSVRSLQTAIRARTTKPEDAQKTLSREAKPIFRATAFAEFLDANLDSLEPGSVLTLPVVSRSEDDDEAPVGEEPPLAALVGTTEAGARAAQAGEYTVTGVVTELLMPSDEDDILNPGHWLVSVALPGESRELCFSLAQPFVRWTNNNAMSRDPALREIGRRIGSFLPEPAARDDATDRTPIVAAFDEAPAGDVMRSRLVLTGNMFQAVRLSVAGSKGKLAQKVIFTTASGNVQHGMMLKEQNETKAVALLSAAVRALPTSIEEPRQQKAMANLVQTSVQRLARPWEPSLKASWNDALVEFVSGGRGVEATRKYVWQNTDDLWRKTALAMRCPTGPTGMFWGSDPFTDPKLLKNNALAFSVRETTRGGTDENIFVGEAGRSFIAAAPFMAAAKDAVTYFPIQQGGSPAPFVFANKAQFKDGMPLAELRDRASTLKGGPRGLLAVPVQQSAVLDMIVEKMSKKSDLGLKGGFATMQNALRAISKEAQEPIAKIEDALRADTAPKPTTQPEYEHARPIV